MRLHRPLALALALSAVSSAACMTTSPSMDRATGPLNIDSTTEDYPAYYDADLDFHPAGSTYVFNSYKVGDTEVDELTFFHVAGETAKAAEVLEFSKKSNMSALVGWSTTGVGLGAVLAGVGLYGVYGADDTETFVTTPIGQASFGLMAVGGVVVGLSFYAATLFGPDRPLNRHELVLDPITDGEPAAERANARLSGETTPAPETPTETPAES